MKIIELLKHDGIVTSTMLAEMLNVSNETIRKDLIQLESEGIVTRSHGGAILNDDFTDSPIKEKLKTHNKEKELLARRVVNLIPDNASVFIGVGSTEVLVAKELILSKKLNITTNSVFVANLLDSEDYRSSSIILLGGMIEPVSLATTGIWAINQIESMHFNYALLGTSGFKDMDGPGTFSYGELAVLHSVIKKSENTIVVADYTKFYKNSTHKFAYWEDIDLLVTNYDESLGNSDSIKNIQKKINVLQVKGNSNNE